MTLLREIALVGLSYRTAPVDIRERASLDPSDRDKRLPEIRARYGLDEFCVLSTCNRTEWIACADDDHDLAPRLALAFRQENPGVEDCHIHVHRGVDAVFHLFRVASGLESQVLGESQILAQVKDAHRAANELGTVGSLLQPLLDQSLAVGKRVRTETKIGEGTLSVARAAVDLAHKVLGSFQRVRALVIGTGETGLLVARHLREHSVAQIHFANRTLARAEEAAQTFGGEVVPFDRIADRISDVQLTVVAVDGFRPLIDASHFDRSRLRRHNHPPVVMDLSVPRAVAPELRDDPDLLVQDLSDLDTIISRHRQGREGEVVHAGRILVEETHKFFALRAYAAMRPVITEIADVFEQVRQTVVGPHAATPNAEELSRLLTRRLLDVALKRLKEGARAALSEEHLGRRYRSHLERTP